MTIDVAIVAAGPVGLHAALKAALPNMSTVVVDKGSVISMKPALVSDKAAYFTR